MWSSLLPLALGSAVVPMQVVVTVLLLRSTSGRGAALAWVAGMSAVRLAQGALFGLVFVAEPSTGPDDVDATTPIISTVLLVLGVLLLVLAVRQLTADEDPDAPPPRWMSMTEHLAPRKAFLLGAGLLLIGPKFWVLTLGAVGTVADADLGTAAAVATFVVFVVLAESLHLTVIGLALLAPSRSASWLTVAVDWMTRHNTTIAVTLGLVVGTYFLVLSMRGFGLL